MHTAVPFVLLLCVASSALAQNPSNASSSAIAAQNAVSMPVRADAVVLARLSQPDALVIQLGREAFRKGVAAAIEADPNFAEIEKMHPGMTKAILDETADVVEAHVKAGMADLHRRYALFYQERLTPSEIKEISAFLQVPAGQRLVAAKFGNIDLESMVEEVVLDPEMQISEDQMKRANRIATARTVRQTSQEDQEVMLKMISVPTLKKMGVVGGELSQMEAKMANEPDPILDRKVEEAMKRALKRFNIAI